MKDAPSSLAGARPSLGRDTHTGYLTLNPTPTPIHPSTPTQTTPRTGPYYPPKGFLIFQQDTILTVWLLYKHASNDAKENT